MRNRKRPKKILNIPRVIVFLLIIYIIVSLGMHVFKEKVHHYEISGLSYYKDVDILRMAHLEDYPAFLSLKKDDIKSTLESDPLIISANVSYDWNYTVKIKIEENTPVLVLKSSNNVVLRDGNQIPYEDKFGALPMLLNNTPTESLVMLVENLSQVDKGILYMISEITFAPSYNSNNVILDDKRFLLSMSDKNQVYINARNCSWLNEYLNVIANNRITEPGTFFFDGNLGKMIYKKASGQEVVVEGQEGEQNG